MKIVAFSHSSELGGSERALAEIVAEAGARGHEVITVLPKRGVLGEHMMAHGLARPRYLHMHRWMSRRGRGLVGFLRLCQCVLDIIPCVVVLLFWRPRVVLVNSSVTPGPLVASRLCGVRTMLVVREMIETGESLQSFLPKRAIVSVLHRASNVVVAVSGVAQRQCGATERIYSNSVAPMSSGSASQLRPVSGHLRAVCVGSLMSDKRPEDAVRAVALAHAAGADVSLRIFGSGSAADIFRVEGAIHDAAPGVVRYCGEAAGPAEAFQYADVLLMTSVHEAFGRVTTEALMVGIPVIGYRCGGTAEVIGLAGGGVLVEATPAALARELISLSQDHTRLTELREAANKAGAFWRSYRSERLMVDRLEELAGSRASDGATQG